MAVYGKGEPRIVELGGLKFVVMHRAFGGDGGVTIEVYGDVEGKDLQVLRFDCFEKAPHYHYAPMGKNVQKDLDAAEVGDTVQWALGQVREHIPEMLREAGYDDLAARVDARALAQGWPRVGDAARAVAAA